MKRSSQVDGNKIQKDIRQDLRARVKSLEKAPRLDIVYAGENSVIETFTQLKQNFGNAIGTTVKIHSYPASVSEKRLAQQVQKKAQQTSVDGLVVQLPLPSGINQQSVLNTIPKSKDVDVLSDSAYKLFVADKSPILPPVVGAIKEIVNRYSIAIAGKSIAVIGRGRLVGQPIIDWLQLYGNKPLVFEKGDDLSQLRAVDIIISGAGDPHVITPQNITEGVILLDAGTSHADGSTQGDVDPACARKAHLYSPVPGGIGPITVAKLFENVVILAQSNR